MSCYVPTINIVKLVNGNVEFYDALTGGFIKMLSSDIVRIEIVGDSVTIIQDNGSIERIHKDNVVNTQILPAAAVAFAGTAADLAALLSASFFFVSSGIALPIDAVDVTYDNVVSGLVATDVQAAIDEVVVDINALSAPAYVYSTDVNSNYQIFLETKQNIITKLYDANTLLAYPVIIREPVKIYQVAIFFTAGAVGAMVYGIYDQAANGLPGNLLFQTTAFNTAVAPAAQNYNLPAPIVLERGVYWIAYNSSSAPTGVASACNGALASLYESGFGAYQSYYFNALAYTGTLPASFGAGAFSATTTINIAAFRTIL